jgi:hypothetical protein
MNWFGMVEAPDGIAGLTLGQLEVPTDVLGSTPNQGEGGTGASEGRLDNQGFFSDRHAALTALVPGREPAGYPRIGLLGTICCADQLGRNGEAALAADGHAIESQENPWLTHQAKQTGCSQTIMKNRSPTYAPIGEHGALVGEGAIVGIANDNISRDFSTVGCEWTASDLEILNLEELALLPFCATVRLT